MLSVSVHKDIGEYTEKVVGKLSARTLACTAGGLAAAVAVAAVAERRPRHPRGRRDPSRHGRVHAVLAARLLATEGTRSEKFVPLFAEHVLGDGKLVYATGSHPASLAGPIGCAKVDRRARRASKRKGAERHVKEL